MMLIGILMAMPLAASAEAITFVFEGTVDSVFDGLGALGDSIQPGTPLTGFYTFDSDTPNTAPPVIEGDLGLYHHEEPPAGVTIVVGPFVFRSVPEDPDFDIHVANDFGIAGTDEYGFVSRHNEGLDLLPSAPIGRLDIDWLAINLEGLPFTSADLPLTPPDLGVLGGGDLTIEGECMICAGPAAFFRIEGTLISLDLALAIWLDRQAITWSRPATPIVYDVLRGDLDTLRDTGGDFVLATDHCLVDDLDGSAFPHPEAPPPGRGFWILVRPAAGPDEGTYDSGGLRQVLDRDEPIALSGRDCP
jgi:hypothetical protein